MKTDPAPPAERREPPNARREPFAESLKQTVARTPSPRAPAQGSAQAAGRPLQQTPPLAAGPKQAHAVRSLIAAGDQTARTLQRARAGHEAHAQVLTERRGHAETMDQVRVEGRVADRIFSELTRLPPEERPAPIVAPPPVGSGSGGAQQAQASVSPPSRAEAAMELVEKIEVWMKSSRPALTLGVGGALQAEVTVERTGPGRISLAFRGKKGPPSHSDVRAVRDALERRGLLLTSVQIG